MKKLSPQELAALRKWTPLGWELSLLDHIDAITAEYADHLTAVQQQMVAISNDLLLKKQELRLHDDT